MIEKVNFCEGDVVIDCGAAQGLFYLALKDLKIDYHGFEPSPVQFEDLSYNLKNKGKLYNKALWNNSNEEIDFYINDWLNDSSVIEIKEFDEIIKVKTITLDEVIKKINKNIRFIKIEAEGAEPEVLYGLNEQINKVHFISIDAGPERYGETTIIECLNYLNRSSFELIGFYQGRVGLLFENMSFEK
jgi:FkbM family methyltransferase